LGQGYVSDVYYIPAKRSRSRFQQDRRDRERRYRKRPSRPLPAARLCPFVTPRCMQAPSPACSTLARRPGDAAPTMFVIARHVRTAFNFDTATRQRQRCGRPRSAARVERRRERWSAICLFCPALFFAAAQNAARTCFLAHREAACAKQRRRRPIADESTKKRQRHKPLSTYHVRRSTAQYTVRCRRSTR